MHQPRLTKLNITKRDGKLFIIGRSLHCLGLAYFLNLPHPNLKYAIQFFLIDTPQNLLQALKKLALLSHLNPFEFFFHCRKQVEVDGAKLSE
jgi:hypothetical protein